MANKWVQLYREAFQERDAEKVSELCDRARAAINERLGELAARVIAAEKERDQLRRSSPLPHLHELHRRAPN